ncbi:hypothetical protein BDU57DRAFT_40928 [Ampelomyces quisqualis]|uniref:Carrier domain-containing protein n=1 Tax=Ampelomyces quisqualis TaxID=50730 RepID=A0A6A5R228_AMPQU|nr:hypothetical protein BDU57DRAFT_40928 [Ampelomyces quisqualis]
MYDVGGLGEDYIKARHLEQTRFGATILMYSGYGPSETTNICTVRTSVSPSDLINNIGKPFDNTSAFVMDPNSGTILPRGAVGELCFGDLGTLLHDGSILFAGRLDDQVKVRGQRVELGEISSTVLDQQCSRDCATLLIQLPQGAKSLVTFWVPATATDTTFRVLDVQDYRSDSYTILSALSQRLPSYMVPSHTVPVSRLPTTTQGKIDKRRLQECFHGLTTEDLTTATHPNGAIDEEASDLTPWELQVSQVLSEQFGFSINSVRRNSSFFSLGMDSISAIQFGNRLRKADLGNFTNSDILKNSTLSRLALLKDTHKRSHQQPAYSNVNIAEAIAADEISRIRNLYEERGTRISRIRPCTPLQEAMLSSARSSTQSSYSNVMVFSINGDLSHLQECWELMVERHEILRTAFVATDDRSHAFVQVVLEDVSIRWGAVDWSSGTQQLANRVISDLLQANRPPTWLALDHSVSTPRLLFCCHHAMYDGIATQTLLREVQEVYYHHKLPPPVSYDLYLQQMLSQDLSAADHFWKATFRNFEPTAFPDLTSKVARTSPFSTSFHQHLQVPLNEVREACQNMSITLLSVVHATWAKLLYFYTGENDVCFGTVVSGRSLSGQGLERLVAPCFNTLPVRIKFDFGKENIALALQAHSFGVESSAFHLTPLRRIQTSLRGDGIPLFDTLVILQNPHEPLDDTIWTLENDLGDMDLPLVCEISHDEAADKLDLVIHYHSTIMSKSEAEIVAKTFDTTLQTIIAQPHLPARDTVNLPSCSSREIESSIMPFQYKRNLLHEGFESNAQTDPHRIALDFMHADGSRTTWSYQTLDRKANDIARAILQHSVEPDDIVPVHLLKGPDFYASILGILKAGVAFAPVHPELPEARRKLMIDDVKAKIVISDGVTSLPELNPNARLLDVGSVQSVRESFAPQIEALNNSNLAYCIFTSGSTGAPKAVSMEHRAPVQTIECSRSIIPWNRSSRLLQYAATTFDMCYYDCFLAWGLGITLCAAEQDMMLNDLTRIINALDVDLLDLTPSVAISLVKSEVPCVKWMYCIGEPMAPNIVKEWEGSCVNSYGPSEAAFCTTIFPVSKDIRPSVIGKPFSGTVFEIFPAHGVRPLPLLSVGELCIGGGQLARGYYNRSELTKDKFVFKLGHRFYRSGDIVRKLVDGNFEFIGRADDQVKIRGLRVELGEINTVLHESHPAITTAVTQLIKKDTASKEQLVAFLVMRPENNDGDEELGHRLKQAVKLCLPPYMVPQFYIFLDRIPRSLANKIDKNALATIFRNSPDAGALPNGTSEGDAECSWNALADEVRHVFAHLSNSPLEVVYPATTIYQLGLDSISAVQIAAALRRKGYNVNATDVMKHLTCVDLAAHIERSTVTEQIVTNRFDFAAFDHKHRPQVLASCNIDDQRVAAIRPCTPLQRGMISQLLAKDGKVYINYVRFDLESDVSLLDLKQAWGKAMATHQILRTGFTPLEDKDHPFGMIEYTAHAATLPWNVVSDDGMTQAPEVWLENLQRLASSELHVPLWSIRVTQEHDANHLHLAMFHALFDAQSLQSILRDVAVAYHGQELEPPTNLDLVISEILQRSTEHTEQAKMFWTRMGEHAVPSRFPNLASLRYDPKPPAVCTHRSTMSLKDMETACRQSNTTLQAAGLASWLALVSAYIGESTAMCGVVLSGRSFEAAEDAVFPCINTVPFAGAVTSDPKGMLASVTANVAEMQQHQHIPVREIQRLMGLPNDALFDTIFAFQKLPSDGTGSVLWFLSDEKATIEYPVSIELEPTGEKLDYRLTFAPHAIPHEQAALILRQLDHILQYFISTPTDEPFFCESLYSITPAKEATLSSEAHLLHDFFELTANKSPQRIALEFAHSIRAGTYSATSWTYAELNAEGNRIAHLLLANGVLPGDLVGVCFDKCPEASFAILGVLKAGAAFVAIDPGAPPARQAFIVQDSGATAILSMSAQSDGFVGDVKVPVMNLDKSETGSFPGTKPGLERAIRPQDRSYCLYTSGTTGTPKGCELTHENAVQALLSFQRLFAGHWTSESRWLQFASFHFDVSVLEQYWSWSVGICVVSAPRDVIFEDLANSISTLGITHIDLTPSLAQTLHPDDVPSLCKGVFITGGESLKQEILDVWGPKGVIYNGYGPTEATIGCTMLPRVPANGKPSNIGPQFDNVGTFVLRPGTDEPVLRGSVGELCVSGKLVGKGYLNHEGMTKKSFPYLERFGERVYRTGDLVRILHDGTFEFLGRADDQVKLRGQRLEIGEINSVIKRANNGISDVATLVLKHPRQQKKQLVAFIVPGRTQGQADILLEALSESRIAKDACHDKLPPYMVPTHFVPLTSIPLNVNNKADVKKLKLIYEALSVAELHQLSATSDEREQSWSSLETQLRTVFKKELDVGEDAIDKETSFFELGMDSISVIGVVRALKKAGIVGATASLAMKHSTIHRLAKALCNAASSTSNRASLVAAHQAINAMQHRHHSTVARSLSVNSSDIEALAPCTPLQQGMIARSLGSETGLYFNMFKFKIGKDVDTSRLRGAWQTVFASTEIMRTVFADTADGFMQVVLHNQNLPWKEEYVAQGLSMESSLAALRKKWLQANSNGFTRPLELVHLTAPTEKRLIVHIFHGLYDGISIQIIFKAVLDAYHGHRLSHDPPSFHSALAHGPLRVMEGAKNFWQQHLSVDIARSPLKSSDASSTKTIQTSRQLQDVQGFESTRRTLNVTAQAIAQACWISILQEHLKGTATIGIVVSGRSIDLECAERIIGPMFNTIPYQHRLQKTESWSSIIKRVHDFNVAVHPYQHTPLRDINKWCNTNRDQPLFDSLFVYQVGEDQEGQLNNNVMQSMEGEVIADYPLSFEVEQRPNGGWQLTLAAQSRVVDDATCKELLDRFEEVMHQVVDNPAALFKTSFELTAVLRNKQENQQHAIDSSKDTTGFTWTNEASTLRKVLAKLTNVELTDINECTSIFELGLDSIDAIKLSSKLKEGGLSLPVSGIMRGLTISKMVPNISKAIDGTVVPPDDSVFHSRKRELRSYIDRQSISTDWMEDILPLTPLQEAMVAEMIASNFARYYNFDVMKLEHGIDIERLRNAWTRVVAASPILRTSFVEIEDPTIDDSFAQVIYSMSYDFWKTTSLNGEPDFSLLFEEVREQARRATSSKPPFRIMLVETPKQNYLVLSIAHALYDGWSLGLLHADVKDAYGGNLKPRPSYQPVLSNALATSGAGAANFWGDYLYKAQPSTFDRRFDVANSESLAVHRIEQHSKIDLARMTDFAKKSNVSLQALGQSVFAIVLASYVRFLDVTFGSVVSGRDEESTSQLLFPTMNTVAIRTILHGSRLELLRHVQESFNSIKQWQHFPLRKALRRAGVPGGLFESLFIYQKSMESGEESGERLYTSIEGHSDVEYPVCSVMEFTPRGTLLCDLPPFEVKEPSRLASCTSTLEGQDDTDKDGRPVTVGIIRQVLAAVSQTPEDEITDDMTIFHLGLDSISAIKVSSLLRKQNIILSVGNMLRAGSINSMAHIADGCSTKDTESEEDYALVIKRVMNKVDLDQILHSAQHEGCEILDMEEVEILPATAGQVYMISMWLNTNGSSFYPEFTYHVSQNIAFEQLQSAWKALITANPILRTYLVATQDPTIPYVQLVRKEDGEECSMINVSGHSKEDMVQSTRQPWVHVCATQVEHGWQLKLKIHHALYDGVSLPLLMQQLQDNCRARTKLIQDGTLTRFIGSHAGPASLEARKLFWIKYLEGFDQSHLPQPTGALGTRTEIFKPALLTIKSLENTARRCGVSIQALFLAAYAVVYARLVNEPKERDVVFGIYLANRSVSIAGIEGAAIPTVNLLPLRVRAPLGHRLTDVAQQIQRDVQRIGERANACASLFEISAWTGVKVDSFVNFLTLPDAGNGKVKAADEEDVKMMAEKEWTGEVHRVVDCEELSRDVDEEQQRRLSNAKVNEAYLHAVDVEATVRNGALDVGVFAPVEMLGMLEGSGLVYDMESALKGLGE